MAVVQKPSAYGFIQQAYQGVRTARANHAKAFNAATLAAVPPALDLRTQDLRHREFRNRDLRSSSLAKRSTPSSPLPYDPTSKRRVAMALVDLCTAYIEGLWPNQQCRLPLRKFVFEILRRSRVQYPVFQVALCYMARLRPIIAAYKDKNAPIPPKLACGRRALVAALQVATKFLQDRCYSAKVWARISGLPLEDLKQNELALMEALDWNMFVSYEAYARSCSRLRVTVDSACVEAICRPSTPAPDLAIPTPEASPAQPAPETSPDKSPEVEIWSQF